VAKQKIILDSSVIVKFLFSEGEEYLRQADQLLHETREGAIDLLAPVLSKYEVGNVIRFRNMTITEKQVNWDNFGLVPIKFIEMQEKDGRRALDIAEMFKITFYDAIFLALAERMKAILVTANPKHQKKLAGVKVVDLKDY